MNCFYEQANSQAGPQVIWRISTIVNNSGFLYFLFDWLR